MAAETWTVQRIVGARKLACAPDFGLRLREMTPSFPLEPFRLTQAKRVGGPHLCGVEDGLAKIVECRVR